MERSLSFDPLEDVDWISQLSNDVLLLISSRLSTEEAIRTSVLSKRWEHLWKQRSHLALDMRRYIKSIVSHDVSNRIATFLTKIINNHHGHLESCVIDHYSYQYENGTLNTWIQSLNGTKHLTLIHHIELVKYGKEFLDFPPNSFSNPSLKSLSLKSYRLQSSHSFNNCRNLNTLKLSCIFAFEVGVFNRVLTSCPSLEVLVLHVCWFNKSGPLKIDNNRLKLLKVSSSSEDFDYIQVSSTSLHILAIDFINCRKDDFVLTSPRLQFNRNFWLARIFLPHISYNISQEEKSIGHEELVANTCRELRNTSLSVSVNLMNPREVERLRQVLLLCTFKMMELEILFKKNNNAPREEGESSSLWEENNKDPFANAKFRVGTVWMHNFSGSEEEFDLASRLIRQGTVINKMMIKTTAYCARKKFEIQTAVAKLKALQTKDQWRLTIQCF